MLEADLTLNVIYITDKNILEIALWEGIPTVYLHIGMNGTRLVAGTVGPCLPLNSKGTPFDPRCILSAPILDQQDITTMSL